MYKFVRYFRELPNPLVLGFVTPWSIRKLSNTISLFLFLLLFPIETLTFSMHNSISLVYCSLKYVLSSKSIALFSLYNKNNEPKAVILVPWMDNFVMCFVTFLRYLRITIEFNVVLIVFNAASLGFSSIYFNFTILFSLFCTEVFLAMVENGMIYISIC